MSLHPRTPVIVAARRSPIGSAGHGLRSIPTHELAAPVLAAVGTDVARGRLSADDVVLGNCLGPGGNIARVSALAAGLGQGVPARTLDLQCGSGLAAVIAAADAVRAGRCDVVLAGGVESASTAPWRHWPPRAGAPPERYERAPFAPPEWPDPDMGAAAEAVAQRFGISRERQDAYAARSHERAVRALLGGVFDDELVPLGGLERDERVRGSLTVERLARLRPAFAVQGTVTAGNSTGISDGAAVVGIVSEARRSELGWPGLAIVDAAVCAGDPALPGVAPVAALREVSTRHTGSWDDVDRIEINEAFAAQVLACCDLAGIAEDRVCVEGGALALGHPWGASGAILLVRLFSQLVRRDAGRVGVAAIAVGGGQGLAVRVERVG